MREEKHHQPEPGVQAQSHRLPQHPESAEQAASNHQPEQAASHRLPVRTGHPDHPDLGHPLPVHPCPDHPRAEQAGFRHYLEQAGSHRRTGWELSFRRWTPGSPECWAHPTRHRRRSAPRASTKTRPWTLRARRPARWQQILPMRQAPLLRVPPPLLPPVAHGPSIASACSAGEQRARPGSRRRGSAGSDRSRSLLVRTVSFDSFCHRPCRR